MEDLRRKSIHTRYMTPFELRQSLKMKNQRIARLQQQIKDLEKQVQTLTEWNLLWQKHRWNEEMAKQCDGLEKELGSLSNNQTTILLYLASAQGQRAERHVRGIARATGLNVATVSKDLKVLRRMKLVRAYLRNSNKKKFYTLPCAKDFIKKHFGYLHSLKYSGAAGEETNMAWNLESTRHSLARKGIKTTNLKTKEERAKEMGTLTWEAFQKLFPDPENRLQELFNQGKVEIDAEEVPDNTIRKRLNEARIEVETDDGIQQLSVTKDTEITFVQEE